MDKRIFGELLQGVANELSLYAQALKSGDDEELLAEGGLSTYAIDAQGLIYDQMRKDGVL